MVSVTLLATTVVAGCGDSRASASATRRQTSGKEPTRSAAPTSRGDAASIADANDEAGLDGGTTSNTRADRDTVEDQADVDLDGGEARAIAEADELPPQDALEVGHGCFSLTQLTPSDLGSDSDTSFGVLPTDNPARFGLDGEVGMVDFDVDASGVELPPGTVLTDQYAAIGVTMNSIALSSETFDDAASPPNAARVDTPQVYSFSSPVVAVGLIDTSPGQDYVEVWSGPNRTGALLVQFRDQQPENRTNETYARFIGGRVCDDATIGSIVVQSLNGYLEVDELIFEYADASVEAAEPELVEQVGNSCANAIELTPDEVGSESPTVFSVLPTEEPTRFSLNGADVRGVDFDVDPSGVELASGTELTDEYASLGVTMNSIRLSDNPYQGPASPPNVAWIDTPHIYSFSVPVVAAGLINTSPDHDYVEFWSGPDRTGKLLLQYRDTWPDNPKDYSIDRFVGARVCDGELIGSIVVQNSAGNLELDELVFEVAP